MNNNNIKNLFKNTKTPVLILFIFLKKLNLTDANKKIILIHFLSFNDFLTLKINIFNILSKENKLSTLLIIKYYNTINKQIKILPFILKIKKSYPYKYFWCKDINNQIEYLKNKLKLFLSYYDCSKSDFTFMIKSRIGYNSNNIGIKIIENEMVLRLIKTKKLFKNRFFIKNSIKLLSYEKFLDLNYENKINYIDYIFINCFKKLYNYITYLELYNIYRMELVNLLNTENINIIKTENDIDFTIDDIYF